MLEVLPKLFLSMLYVRFYPSLFSSTACDCDPRGSESMQCDKRTGQCQCVAGVTGYKCDRCARGTTGQLPNCVPCGECFDNWDRVIRDLRGEGCFLCLISSPSVPYQEAAHFGESAKVIMKQSEMTIVIIIMMILLLSCFSSPHMSPRHLH